MNVSVIHHSLDLLGGGERACVSLLRALDKTMHETVLRCAVPPPGVRFAGDSDGGDAAPNADAAPSATFRRVRLDRIPRRGAPCGTTPDFANFITHNLFGQMASH